MKTRWLNKSFNNASLHSFGWLYTGMKIINPHNLPWLRKVIGISIIYCKFSMILRANLAQNQRAYGQRDPQRKMHLTPSNEIRGSLQGIMSSKVLGALRYSKKYHLLCYCNPKTGPSSKLKQLCVLQNFPVAICSYIPSKDIKNSTL